VDFDGRILAQADPGPGEKIVIGPIDLAALRVERERRRGHHMLAHLRMEAYPAYRCRVYPGSLGPQSTTISIAGNEQAIDQAKGRLFPKER